MERAAWLEVWLAAAALAFVLGGTDTLRKIRAQRASLDGGTLFTP